MALILIVISNTPSYALDKDGLVRIVLEEDAQTAVFQPNVTTSWDWTITHDGTQVGTGTSAQISAQTVANGLGTYAGVATRSGNAGGTVTFTFVRRNAGDTAWEANGWVLTAKIYERFGIDAAGLTALNAATDIHQSVKPITQSSGAGMSTFLANQVGGAQYNGRWYIE